MPALLVASCSRPIGPAAPAPNASEPGARPAETRLDAVGQAEAAPEEDIRTQIADEAYRAIEEARFDDAEAMLREALSKDDEAHRADRNHAIVLSALGRVLVARGDFASAEPALERAVEIHQRLDSEAGAGDSQALAEALSNLATLWIEEQEYVLAESLLRQALGINERILGRDHAEVASSLNRLAVALKRREKLVEAESLLVRCLAIREKLYGRDDERVATALGNLSSVYVHQGKLPEAEKLSLRCLEISTRIRGPNHPTVATELNNLGLLYAQQDKWTEAVSTLERSLAIRESVFGRDNPVVADSLENLGVVLAGQTRLDESVASLEECLRIRESLFEPDDWRVRRSLNYLGELQFVRQRFAEARELMGRLIESYDEVNSHSLPVFARSHRCMAWCFLVEGRNQDAAPHISAMQTILRNYPPRGEDARARDLRKRGRDEFASGRHFQAQSRLLAAAMEFELAHGLESVDAINCRQDAARSLRKLGCDRGAAAVEAGWTNSIPLDDRSAAVGVSGPPAPSIEGRSICDSCGRSR